MKGSPSGASARSEDRKLRAASARAKPVRKPGGQCTKLAAAVLAALCAVHPARAASPPADQPLAEPTIRVDRIGGAVRIDAALPGTLRAYALPRLADGKRRRVALLVRPRPPVPSSSGEEGTPAGSPGKKAPVSANTRDEKPADPPLWLAWFDPSDEARIEIDRRDLPADARAIDAIDLDGHGGEELVIWRAGEIDALVAEAVSGRVESIERLISDPEIHPVSADARALCDLDCAGERILWSILVGSLRGYGPSVREPNPAAGGTRGTAAAWAILADLPLPVSASRSGSMLMLSGPAVRPLGGAAPSAGRLVAVGPEPYGTDRLRTLLIDPSLPAETGTTECWSLLPAPEKVIESAYLRIDGRPALAVTTRSAEKLELFAEKRLRVYLLESDRTRRGRPPTLAADTRINLWQSTDPIAIDVDHDGRQDLVLGYWKGLKNHHLVLDAYLQTEDGGFATSARTTSFEVKDARRSFLSYGHDLDGDGFADLVLLAANKVLVYPGSPKSSKGRDLVAEAPRWELPLSPPGRAQVNVPESDGDEGDFDSEEARAPPDPRSTGSPRFVDVDGDGREEIFIAGSPLMGSGHVLIYLFPSSAP